MKNKMAFRLRRRALARYSSAILACGVLAAIPNAACSKNNTQKQTNKAITQNVSIPTLQKIERKDIDLSKIDIDMTKMSSTMIYSEVFNMLIEPEEFLNKLIKVSGNFQVFETPEGERYFAIIIPDATKCCQQGIEFIWQGEHTYPSDYPEIGKEITITGTYNCAEMESGALYTYLDVWELN